MLLISSLKHFPFLKHLIFCADLFGHIEKNGLIGKLRLISKFKTSQPGKQTFTPHIIPTISRNTGNQAKKFLQLMEYNVRNISLHKSSTEWGRETSSRPIFFFFKKKKTFIRGKNKWSLHLSFIYFDSTRLEDIIKTN